MDFNIANDAEHAEKDEKDEKIRELEDSLRAEVSRYRGMISYAHHAPTFDSCKSILTDALDGVNGAENYKEVKGDREMLRARAEKAEAALCQAEFAWKMGNVTELLSSFSSSSPCPHEDEAKRLREALDEAADIIAARGDVLKANELRRRAGEG